MIIGSGTLPLRCAELLIGNGHILSGLLSKDTKIKRWGKDRGIPVYGSSTELLTGLQEPVDYLFSIVNDQILSQEIIELPLKSAINYHDGPLPRYAGTHATSWAIINQERSHGITWHLITDVVDAGDILKQKTVDIAENETAHSLNTKCYEAATQAFGELIDELADDTGKREPQNLADRTFFPRFKRPANGGVIRWDSPAKDISALIRALDFGPHPNPLGVPKIAIDETFVIVSDVERTGLKAESRPGTVNEIGTDHLRISAVDEELVLRRFAHLDGVSIAVADLAAGFDVREGFILPILENDEYGLIENRIKEISKYEPYLVSKLSELDPATPPIAFSRDVNSVSVIQQIPVTVPEQFRKLAELSGLAGSFERYITAAFGGFVARLVENHEFAVGYSESLIQEAAAKSRGLLAERVSFRFDVDLQKPFDSLLRASEVEHEAVKKNWLISRDIYARYPALASATEATKSGRYPFNIVLVDGITDLSWRFDGDITLIVDRVASDCRLVFDRTRVAAADINQFLSSFSNFLKGIAADSDLGLAQHPLLDKKDRDVLLYELNSRSVELPDDVCIHHLFEAQVLRTPENVALIVENREYTYQQLNERAEQIADHLVSSGVEPEVLVAICMQRSFAMVAGILGILKAGGAYVPLDPAYPKARLDQILEDSRAPVLLSQPSVREKLGRTDAQIILIDENFEPSEIAPPRRTNLTVKPDNLAYVIYTSGSTGKPKGVAIEHRNTVAFLIWATTVFSVDQLKGTVASTSVCFDLSVFEIFAPLICGGTVVLVENILHLPTSPAADRATLINTVPSAIAELLKMNGIPDSVATVNLAGEPLKTSLVKRIYESGSVKTVYDLYGPTEDTTYSTYTLRTEGPATIGRPIDNTRAYILDKNLEPVPPGFPGELYLAGDGLARGYLNQPDLTDARFIKNPFVQDGCAKMYKTGDLVRYLPSFEIEYLGRIDNQVKVRGFRIEVGEIETVLSSHPSIEEVALVAATDDSRGTKLVAYFVGCRSDIGAIGELREFLKEKLPDYMIPSAFVQLDEMPLTPNGKLDRKRLPAPSTSLSNENLNYVAPRNDVETRLVRIWERLLNLNPIGVRDNFFELGGDSLVSVSLFVEIENEFGVELPLSVLIGSPTIEKLVAELGRAGESVSRQYLVPLRSEGDQPAIFCMHAAGGNVLFYRDLASELGDDQPFYGLQARGVADKSQTAHDRIEDMTRDYLVEIQSLQPHGPYHLSGASFGGLVAFEAARQLLASGETVATIAVFDTYAPGYLVPSDDAQRDGRLRSLIFRAKGIQGQLASMENWKQRAAFVGSKVAKVHKKMKRKIAWTKNQFAIEYNKATGRELPQNMMRNHAAIRKAMDSYMPDKFDGDLLIFRASDQPSQKVDRQLGWNELVGGKITVVDVKGQHGALTVYPFASDLAMKYRPFLRSEPESPGIEAAKRVTVAA